MRVTDKYVFFWTAKDCFSQWYPAQFVVDGFTFLNAEQYMMFEKARIFKYQESDMLKLIEIYIEEKKNLYTDKHDESSIAWLLNAPSRRNPNFAKKFGRAVQGYDDDVWKDNVSDVIYRGNMAKFSQNPKLLRAMLHTGDRSFAEASPYDLRYGIGMREDDEGVEDVKNWRGGNLLGQILNEVRDDLRFRQI